MTAYDPSRREFGHIIDVVAQNDVEAYAQGRLNQPDAVRLVEQAMLADDAARDTVRAILAEDDRSGDALLPADLPCEPLKNLAMATRSCMTLADFYDHLNPYTDYNSTLDFLRRRAAVFHSAAAELSGPLGSGEDLGTTARPDGHSLLSLGARRLLADELHSQPARAIRTLADLHEPLLRALRNLIHSPWPLKIKLLIADTVAMIQEELDAGAWRLKRQASQRN